MPDLAKTLQDAIAPAVQFGVRNALMDQRVPINSTAPTAAAAAIAADAASMVSVDPIVQHLTNNEPWYQSRVTWGVIIASSAQLIGLVIGRGVTAEEQALLVQVLAGVGTLIGGALTLYGRWRATKPLGA